MKKPKKPKKPAKHPINHPISVQYALASRRGVPAASSLRTWACAALDRVLTETAELSIRLVNEDEITDLNQRFRNKSSSTNVLSFPIPALPENAGFQISPKPLGDVILCTAVAQRESQQQNKSTYDHIAHLVVHGVLHLNGFDHQNDEQAEVMENLEREILQSLGIDDPYACTI